MASRGDLYRKPYQGRYCVGCEQFYTDAELDGGRCPEHGTATETVEEDNWFFRLSAYADHLEAAITSGTLVITPDAYRAEALAVIRAGLADISVSRAASRARGWGIPVPGDPDQVIYVWFDALGNYLSALGYATPAHPAYRRWWAASDERIHVVGKGILRFHAIYWPAFLASAGEPAPTRIHVHPYLSINGAKISKSTGTTLDPLEVIDRYGLDALRWWFARRVHSVTDTDFSVARLVQTANDDLAGGFANYLNRVTTLLHRHRHGLLPDLDEPALPAAARLCDTATDRLARLDLRGGTQALLDALTTLNRDLEATAPWKLAKDPARNAELDQVLARHACSATLLVDALAPILPDLAAALRGSLTPTGGRIPRPRPSYPRLETGLLPRGLSSRTANRGTASDQSGPALRTGRRPGTASAPCPRDIPAAGLR